jgi:hypothetical protein
VKVLLILLICFAPVRQHTQRFYRAQVCLPLIAGQARHRETHIG